MTATQVDFTSYVDKEGYKIVPKKRPPLQPAQSILDTPARDWAEARVVGLGGSKRPLRLSNYPLLFREFVNVTTPEKLLNFITKYGPLTKKNEIQPLIDAAERMKQYHQRQSELPSWPIADLKASLSKGVIKFRPATLLDALWLQLAQALSGGTEWRECEHCGDWFPVGGKSGRRLVARFCTDQHRIEFNSLERSRHNRSRR